MSVTSSTTALALSFISSNACMSLGFLKWWACENLSHTTYYITNLEALSIRCHSGGGEAHKNVALYAEMEIDTKILARRQTEILQGTQQSPSPIPTQESSTSQKP